MASCCLFASNTLRVKVRVVAVCMYVCSTAGERGALRRARNAPPWMGTAGGEGHLCSIYVCTVHFLERCFAGCDGVVEMGKDGYTRLPDGDNVCARWA
jgi:hypothetical protein